MTANINPNAAPKSNSPTEFSDGFAALVKVVSSRYDKRTEIPGYSYTPTIVVKWTLLSTKGNTFEKEYSTGIVWGEAVISEDGKKISSPFKPNSDAFFMLEQAIKAGFPSDLITDDISVFDNQVFLIADAKNPRAKGSKPKPYPKKFHSEPWEQAVSDAIAKRAAKEAQQSAPAYSPQSSTAPQTAPITPAKVTIHQDVLSAAGGALMEILATSGTAVKRTDLPVKLNAIAPGKNWTPKMRQDVTLALWDVPQLTVVAATVGLLVSGEPDNPTIGFNK